MVPINMIHASNQRLFKAHQIWILENTRWNYATGLEAYFFFPGFYLFRNPDEIITGKEMENRDSSWFNFQNLKGDMLRVPSRRINMAGSHNFSFGPILDSHKWKRVNPCLVDCMAVKHSIWVLLLMAHHFNPTPSSYSWLPISTSFEIGLMFFPSFEMLKSIRDSKDVAQNLESPSKAGCSILYRFLHYFSFLGVFFQ